MLLKLKHSTPMIISWFLSIFYVSWTIFVGAKVYIIENQVNQQYGIKSMRQTGVPVFAAMSKIVAYIKPYWTAYTFIVIIAFILLMFILRKFLKNSAIDHVTFYINAGSFCILCGVPLVYIVGLFLYSLSGVMTAI